MYTAFQDFVHLAIGALLGFRRSHSDSPPTLYRTPNPQRQTQDRKCETIPPRVQGCWLGSVGVSSKTRLLAMTVLKPAHILDFRSMLYPSADRSPCSIVSLQFEAPIARNHFSQASVSARTDANSPSKFAPGEGRTSSVTSAKTGSLAFGLYKT